MGREKWLALRSAIYIGGFAIVALYLVPLWIGLRTSSNYRLQQPWRWLGLAPALIGLFIAFRTWYEFVTRGLGTPAPFDAPRKLVVSGVYRYVRNPMYVGCGLFLFGCALLLAEFSAPLWEYAAGLAICVNLLILLYEERALRRKFGADYEEYCRNVGRWIPRLHPWTAEQKSASVGATS